jgi:hypothetical protein
VRRGGLTITWVLYVKAHGRASILCGVVVASLYVCVNVRVHVGIVCACHRCALYSHLGVRESSMTVGFIARKDFPR